MYFMYIFVNISITYFAILIGLDNLVKTFKISILPL